MRISRLAARAVHRAQASFAGKGPFSTLASMMFRSRYDSAASTKKAALLVTNPTPTKCSAHRKDGNPGRVESVRQGPPDVDSVVDEREDECGPGGHDETEVHVPGSGAKSAGEELRPLLKGHAARVDPDRNREQHHDEQHVAHPPSPIPSWQCSQPSFDPTSMTLAGVRCGDTVRRA